jgi:hypothetical protein
MKLAIVLFSLAATLVLAAPARAAITTDVGCTTENGVTVYWESQPIWNEEDPQDSSRSRENLYFGHIRISQGKTEVVFEPTHVLTDTNSGALLAAWGNDGQMVIVNTLEAKSPESDERRSAGVIELRIKKKKGTIVVPAGTRAKCEMHGEA